MYSPISCPFLLGFVWHLVLFKHYYDQLEIYRADVIIPFGLLSMTIQALLFAWVYEQSFARGGASLPLRMVTYAAFGAVLSWSFTTIAVAAKNVMSSVPDYLLIETGFTIAQWLIVGPLTAFAFHKAARGEEQIGPRLSEASSRDVLSAER